MAVMRWCPRTTFTQQEQFLMKRLVRTRKLFGFLRTHRGELFDDAFQAELESMYRDTGAGKDPVAPAMLAMVVLLQGYHGYHGTSDAEAVEMSVVDLRWQLVLDGDRAARFPRLRVRTRHRQGDLIVPASAIRQPRAARLARRSTLAPDLRRLRVGAPGFRHIRQSVSRGSAPMMGEKTNCIRPKMRPNRPT
jgi:hypothetical protein